MRYQDGEQGWRGQNMGGRGNGGGYEDRGYDDRRGGSGGYEMRGRDMGGQQHWQGQGYAQQGHGGMQQGRMRDSGDERMEREESNDAIVKVIEVVAQSDRGWDEAARRAVEHASKSIRNIRSVYVKDMQAIVRDGRITQFRIVAKISFVLEGSEDRDREMGRGQQSWGRG